MVASNGSTVVQLERQTVLHSAQLMDLLRRWQAWPRLKDVPFRSAFDPTELGFLWEMLTLVSVDRRANAFRSYDLTFRYLGSSITYLFDATWHTGRTLSSLEAAFAERWFRVADVVLAERNAAIFHSSPQLVGKDFINFELLALPLSTTGQEIDFLLGAIVPLEP